MYKKAHFELQKTYKINNFKYSKNLELFIDSTDIYNKKGVENIGYGPNPKKQISRLSIICDINKNIHSITLDNANTKIINPKTGTEKPRIRKTMPYDNQTITTSLNDPTVRKVKYRNLYLVGDGPSLRSSLFKKYYRRTPIIFFKKVVMLQKILN